MTLLFRLKNFEDIDEVKDYFKNILPKRDNNYFFNVSRLKQIEENEIIYFSFSGYIVATATFMGEIITDTKRDKKFIFGHKLTNIKIVNPSTKLDVKIFGTNTTYLNTLDKIDAIKEYINERI